MTDIILLGAVAWGLSAALLLACWAWYRRAGNAGIVDVGWSLSLPLIAVVYAWLGPGYAVRRGVIALMFVLWGGRLATYLLRDRVVGREEDRRYADLRARRSPVVALDFFLFFQAHQATTSVFVPWVPRRSS